MTTAQAIVEQQNGELSSSAIPLNSPWSRLGASRSACFPDVTPVTTWHNDARQTAFLVAGNKVGEVVVMIGINDIGWPGGVLSPTDPAVSVDDLIAGYRQLIAQAHVRNIRIIGATLIAAEQSGTQCPHFEQASADTPRGQLWSWMQALPETIRHYLSRWQVEWTGESLRQGYLGYVLPCRCKDGTPAILKLSADAHGAEEQAIALSAWAGDGAVPLLAKSFEENGAALLIGRIAPGVALRPIDDPSGQRIARCLQRLAHIPASSVHGSLPSGLERLDALIAANARHLPVLSPSLRRDLDTIIALANAVRRSQRPQERAPCYFTVTFMPGISCSTATMNSWQSIRSQPLANRSKTLGTPLPRTTGAKSSPRELNGWRKPATLTTSSGALILR